MLGPEIDASDAERDVLAYMAFPPAHRAKLHSTKPFVRLNGEIKRRTDVVGRAMPSTSNVAGSGGVELTVENPIDVGQQVLQRALDRGPLGCGRVGLL